MMSGRNSVILAVDDDSANLTLINGILGGLYKVYPINSGEDALDFLELRRPDLILMDVEMPGMSGTELFGRLQANPALSDIPVIFLTGLNDMESEASAFRLGAADFIRKPVNDVIMLARVKMHLELSLLRSFRRALLTLEGS